MRKLNVLFLSLALIPSVAAEKCGITNFITCVPQKVAEYILMIFNAPILPLMGFINKLLTEPVVLDIFQEIWGVMIYMISMFYGLLFLFSGFNFIVSGYDAEKRANAKEWLKNTLLMIFFVQASFLIYSLLNDVSSMMAAGVMNMIDNKFFALTADNFVNFGLSIVLSGVYTIILTATVILLGLRYILVAGGVVFFPIGLFLYFIPPLRGYGKLIIDTLFVLMFLPFVLSLELLMASLLIEVSVFDNFKIVLMIAGFMMVDMTMFFLLFFAVVKAAMSVLRSDVGQAAKMVIAKVK